MRSVNGYDVIPSSRTDGPLPRLRKWVIPGTGRHLFLRDGSVGFLLVHLALRFHETIERIDRGVWDEWGWAVRPVRGKTSGYSNHASGTAMDLNATEHPLGVPVERTFTLREKVKIRLLVAFYRGCIVWGGEWRRPDGMHFEIAAPLPRCEKRARRLMRTPRGRRILAANPGAEKVIRS